MHLVHKYTDNLQKLKTKLRKHEMINYTWIYISTIKHIVDNR